MQRALRRVAVGNQFAGLVLKQVHRVTGMVPKQMIGPASRLARRVHIRAAGKNHVPHVHLLDLQLTRRDFFVNVLVTGVKPPRVTAHADDAGFFLHSNQAFGIRQRVRDRNFDLHVLAGAHALLALRRVHSGGRRQDYCFEAGLLPNSSVRSPVQCGMWNFLATSSVVTWFPPDKVITSIPGILAIASKCLTPKAPCPATPTFMFSPLF